MSQAPPTTIDPRPAPTVASRDESAATDLRFGRAAAHIAGWLRRLSTHAGTLTLIDQAIVSGTSFTTTVIVGRMCGASALGTYSLAFSLVFIAITSLNALVLIPYTVHVNRSGQRSHRSYAGASLVQTGGLAIVALIVFALWAISLWVGQTPAMLAVVCGMGSVLPFILFREFARRFAFAHFQPARAILLDSMAAGIQLTGLVSLAAVGWLSATTAILTIGIAATVAGIVWWRLARRELRMRRRSWWPALGKNWRFGRWVFAGQLVSVINSDILMLWLLVFILGEAASGLFAACFSVVLFANPFILGVGHILTPRVSKAFADGGHRGLRREVAKSAAFVGGVMCLFCIAVLLMGDLLITTLYGSEYAGHQATIFLLAVGMLVRSIGLAVSTGLWALDRPDRNFKASVVGLIVTLGAACALIPACGLLGTALALAIGGFSTLFVRTLSFWSLTAETASESL